MDSSGITPLGYVASRNVGDIVSLLLQAGADAGGKSGGVARRAAAMANDTKAVKILIEKGVDVNSRDPSQRTALHEPAEQEKVLAEKELLVHMADINALSENGSTPLHIAAARGNVEVIQVLLVAHADKAIRRKDGRTALEIAESQGRCGEWENVARLLR